MQAISNFIDTKAICIQSTASYTDTIAVVSQSTGILFIQQAFTLTQ